MDHMGYKTTDADTVALELLERARRRLMSVNCTVVQQKRATEIIASLGKNAEAIKQRSGAN